MLTRCKKTFVNSSNCSNMQLNETSSFDVWTRKWLRKCLSSTYMSISEASKAYRYFWSLVFWWKIKTEECLGPYLWTWSLKCFIQRFFILVTFFAFFDVFYFTLNVFSSMTKIKTNHDCDLCQAALRSFSILLFSLAVVRAAFQQWRCHKAHSSFTLTSDDIQPQ